MDTVIENTRRWVADFVVGLNLCPFARLPMESRKVRFQALEESATDDILRVFDRELDYLNGVAAVETSILILPGLSSSFHEYLDILDVMQTRISERNLEGVYQIASFHPKYVFAGAEEEAASNYTNRSPYPLLHLIRESSIDIALKRYGKPEQIPVRNISEMNRLGRGWLQRNLESYQVDHS